MGPVPKCALRCASVFPVGKATFGYVLDYFCNDTVMCFCLYKRARLILVGRVKQIRHGEGYLRFALVGSSGDHFLFENAMDFVRCTCDPCKNQYKMGNPLWITVFSNAKCRKSTEIQRKSIEIHRKSIEIQSHPLEIYSQRIFHQRLWVGSLNSWSFREAFVKLWAVNWTRDRDCQIKSKEIDSVRIMSLRGPSK